MSADNNKQDPWVGSLRTPYKPSNKPFKPTVPREPNFHTSKRSGGGSRDSEPLPAHQRKVSGPLGSVDVQRSRAQQPNSRYESPVPSAAAKGSNSKFVWELSLRPTTQHNPNGIRRDYHAQAKPYRRMTNDTAPKRDVKTPTDATRVPRMPKLAEEDDVPVKPLSRPPPITTQLQMHDDQHDDDIHNTPTRSENDFTRGINPITHEPLPYSPVKEQQQSKAASVVNSPQVASPAASNAPFATEFNTPADDVALDKELRTMGSLDGTPREPVMIDFATMQAHDTTTYKSWPNSLNGTPKGTPKSQRGGSARRFASRLGPSSPLAVSSPVAKASPVATPVAITAVAVAAMPDEEATTPKEQEQAGTPQQPETPQQPLDDSFEVVEEPEVEDAGVYEMMRVPAAQFVEEEEDVVEQEQEEAPQHVREVSFAADLVANPEEEKVVEEDNTQQEVHPTAEEDDLVFPTTPVAVLYDENDEVRQEEEEEHVVEDIPAVVTAEDDTMTKDVEEEEFQDAVEHDNANNVAVQDSEELVVPNHDDFVVPEDMNVTAEDAQLNGDEKTEELPAQLSTDEALKHTPAGQRLIHQAQIVAQMTVRQATDQLAAGTMVHKAWVRDGKQKGSTRHVKAKVLNDLVLLTYQSGMVKKSTTVVVIRCCLTIEHNKTTLLLDTDNGTLSVQPLTPQHETLWALGINAMLHVAEKQDALNLATTLEDLSWHGIVQGNGDAAVEAA